ncbi:hypothetical protein [Virgibacillus sp. CBA3643]|uniref:beta family protein n=1 Tax=Virgibacillus sp. CBA3643 TaxID=2942278 RepID=UPI0035A28C0F
MTKNTMYFPILKWKTGEKNAIENLSEAHKRKINPIIEIVDYEEPRNFLSKLDSIVSGNVYIDTIHYENYEANYTKEIVEASREFKTRIIPVLYYESFKKLPSMVEKKIAIKIPIPEDFDGETNAFILNEVEKWCSENDTRVDLIFDLEYVDKENASIKFKDLVNTLEEYLVDKDFCEKIIVSVTSFPIDLSYLSAGEEAFIGRFDKKVFRKLINHPKLANLKELMYYSDYGLTRFTETEIDFSKMRYGILPKARYTIQDYYWVLKGKKDRLTRESIINHRTLAKKIYNSAYYYKETFSYGDREIKERGLGEKGPGNNTNWVTIAANHHIAVVIEELSSNPES